MVLKPSSISSMPAKQAETNHTVSALFSPCPTDPCALLERVTGGRVSAVLQPRTYRNGLGLLLRIERLPRVEQAGDLVPLLHHVCVARRAELRDLGRVAATQPQVASGQVGHVREERVRQGDSIHVPRYQLPVFIAAPGVRDPVSAKHARVALASLCSDNKGKPQPDEQLRRKCGARVWAGEALGLWLRHHLGDQDTLSGGLKRA